MKHAGDVRIICVSRDFPVKFNGKEKMEKTSFEEEGWFGGYFGGKQHSNLLPLLWLLREAVKKKTGYFMTSSQIHLPPTHPT